MIVGVVVSALTAAVVMMSLVGGELSVSMASAVAVLRGGGSDLDRFVVWDLRLPRALTAVAAGWSFGAAGAVFQSLARNPLGSPDVVGFTSGSALGAVTAISLLGATTSAAIAAAAVVGGVVTAVVVAVAVGTRGNVGVRLVLVGIGVAAAARAGTDLMLTRSSVNDAQQAMVWLTGSLNGRTWQHLTLAMWGALACGASALAVQPFARLLECGDDLTISLGARAGVIRLVMAASGVGLAATATAAVGPVLFVSLAAPALARRVALTPGLSVAVSGAMGSLLVASADLVGSRVVGGVEFPVGVVTALVGAPHLLWLLQAHRSPR